MAFAAGLPLAIGGASALTNMLGGGGKSTGPSQIQGLLDMIRQRVGANNPGGLGPLNFPRGFPQVPGRQQAFTTLNEILGRQGKTDPQAMNQLLASVTRDAQTGQDVARGELARAGLQGSGVGQALMSAIEGSGAEARTQVRSAEAQRAEDRMREDLMLFLQLALNPALDVQSIQAGIQSANRQYDSQRRGDYLGLLGSLGGGLLGNWDDIF